MLVQRIFYFIKTLERESSPIKCDVQLRKCLSEYFAYKDPSYELSQLDIEVLLSCYKDRWDAIIDCEDDYTRNPSAVNALWIDLSRELEPFTDISYLKILIYTLTNDSDLNDLSPLTETVNLFNFYLGYGGTTLYRKWSFCGHLRAREYELSTHRSLLRKLSPFTIEELARLKLCKQTSREVSFNTERFTNFWDFMRKKVFPHLSDQ